MSASVLIIVGVAVVVMIIAAVVSISHGEPVQSDRVVSSHSLTEEIQKERREAGEKELTVSNDGVGNMARKDDSWNSVGGFFVDLVKGRKE